MKKLTRAWYVATAYIPRRLPRTESEFLFFKDVLIEAFDVKDEPVSWHCIAGAIGAVPAHKTTRSWGAIANVAKRLTVNKLAQSYRAKAQRDLEEQLAKLQEKEMERLKDEDSKKLTKEEFEALYPETPDAQSI